MYDVAIIGAGINGCAMAYELTHAKKRVVLFDMQGIAKGGSGAAGAFISPKFSKSGELKELIGSAFEYSLDFYEQNFPQFLTKAQLLHIAKDDAENEQLKAFKEDTHLKLQEPHAKILNKLSTHAKEQESVCIDAGVVDAQKMCKALAMGAELKEQAVESLEYDDGLWIINETYTAKQVVLATGAYMPIIKEPYIELRGVWGHRIDVQTTTENENSIHQFVSISPSKDGMLAIGATHNVHYHPQKNKEPYDFEAGRAELLEKASRTLELEDVEVVQDYVGLRSGSFDYMPLIGKLVLGEETLACCAKKVRVKKTNHDEFVYYPELYVINGNGGYGFVLAPYLAKMLRENMLEDTPLSTRLTPSRFFARWAKRS